MTDAPTYGSLFSGIGGLDLGVEAAGFVPRWQVENDPWCQRLLALRWPTVTRYGDIHSVDPTTLAPVDLIVGGASPSVPLADSRPRLTPAGSGPSSSGSFAVFDPASSSWRTYATSLWSTAAAPWPTYSGGWPARGTMLSGTCSARTSWAHPTDVTASSSGRGGPNVRDWPTPKAAPSGPDYARAGRAGSGADDLATAAAKAWPTPRASEWKGTGPLGSKSHAYRVDRHYLDATVQATEQASGPLNPLWVEWLMGLPLGWTDPDRADPAPHPGWQVDPADSGQLPRLLRGVPHHRDRLKAIGNAVVPAQAEWAARDLLQHLPANVDNPLEGTTPA